VNVMRYLNNLERLRSKMRIPEQTAPHSGANCPPKNSGLIPGS
jgi:hypothetical protein